MWSLNHIKRAGINQGTMVSVYCAMLRPLIEFCSAVYHPMLNEQQSVSLERLQSSALKIIFGFGKSTDELLRLANITSLKVRREAAFLNLARSMVKNERYSGWFPLNSNVRTLRNDKYYKECLDHD